MNKTLQEVAKIVRDSTSNYDPIQDTYMPSKEVEEPKLSNWNMFIAGFLCGIIPSILYIILNH